MLEGDADNGERDKKKAQTSASILSQRNLSQRFPGCSGGPGARDVDACGPGALGVGLGSGESPEDGRSGLGTLFNSRGARSLLGRSRPGPVGQ